MRRPGRPSAKPRSKICQEKRISVSVLPAAREAGQKYDRSQPANLQFSPVSDALRIRITMLHLAGRSGRAIAALTRLSPKTVRKILRQLAVERAPEGPIDG